MSPLALVGMVVLGHLALADVSHVLQGDASPAEAREINYNLASPQQPRDYWWMNPNSPLKDAYEYYKKCSAKGNCLPPPPADAQTAPPPQPQPFRPQPNPFVPQKQEIDINKNPFFNGQFQGITDTPKTDQIDISKNPFLNGVVTTGNGAPIPNEKGFLGVQPVQPFGGQQNQNKKPFATTHPLENKKPFATTHPLNRESEECRGSGRICVDKANCINGVVNKNGEGLLQVRSDVQYCDAAREVCCQISEEPHLASRINDLSGITAGKSSVPGSTIKFLGSPGLSPGSIQVIVEDPNIKPNIYSLGESGSQHSSSSTPKTIRDVSSPNSVFSSTPDYSDTKFNDVRFASTIQGPAYLPPRGGPPPPTERTPDLEIPRVSTYQPSIPTPRPSSPSPFNTVVTSRPPSPFTVPVIVSSPSGGNPYVSRPSSPPTYLPPSPTPNRVTNTYIPPSTPRPTPRPTTVREYLPPSSSNNINNQYVTKTTPKPYTSITPRPQPKPTTSREYLPPHEQPPSSPRPSPFQTQPPSRPTSPPYRPPPTQPPYSPPTQPPYRPQPSSPRPQTQPPYSPQPSTNNGYQYTSPQTQPPFKPQPSSPRPQTQPPYRPQPSTNGYQYPSPSTARPQTQPPFRPQPSSPRPQTQPPYRPQPSTNTGYQYPSPSTPRPQTQPTQPPYRPQPSTNTGYQYPSPSTPRPQTRPTQPPYRPQPSTNTGYQYPSPSTARPQTQPPYRPQPSTNGYQYPSPSTARPQTQPPFRPQPSTNQGYPSPSTARPQTQPPFRPQPSTNQGYQYPKPSTQQQPSPSPTNTRPAVYLPPSTTSRPPPTQRPYTPPPTQRPYTPPRSPQPGGQSTVYLPPTPPPRQPSSGYNYPQPTPSFNYPSPTPPTSSNNIHNNYLPPPSSPPQPRPPTSSNNIHNNYLPPPSSPPPPRPPTQPPTVTYLPPTSSTPYPGYDPSGDQSGNNINILFPPGPPQDQTPPSSCAAALKCVQEIYCTADGFISTVPVVLTKEQEINRVPTTACLDQESGITGKCCRDANYVDPWPSANLVNGEDDGTYREDDNLGQYTPDLQRNVRSDFGGPRQQDTQSRNSFAPQQQQQPQQQSETCGVRNFNTNPPGVGPLDVNFAEIPWQAMILRQSNKSLLCGGAIIKHNAILTTAHCVQGLETSDVLVKGGEWKLGIDEEPLPFQIVKVSVIARHPEYRHGSLLNDLAILFLEEKLRPAKNIGTICLPQPNQIPTQNCIATGWGKRILQLHAKGAIMHAIDVNVMDNQQCQQTLADQFQHVLENYSPNTLCGYSDKDQCRVDHGSALACSTGNNQYTLSGIFAWDTGCKQRGQIGGYIAPDVEWIESSLSKPINELKQNERTYLSTQQ